MRIHVIQTGSVAIKTRHRQGVGNGMGRMLNTLLDKSWTEFLPVFCWVIEHPEGVIVIDTGETSQTSIPGYFPRWHPFFRFGLKMNVESEQEIGPQIKRLGIHPSDVRWVILTHLHTDHAGGLYHFPKSEILVSQKEHHIASGFAGKMRGYLPQRWPAWFHPRLIDYDHRSVGPFSQSYTLTAAGDVMIIPTPGHTPGHQSVLLQDGKLTYLIAGDTSYTEELMLNGAVDGVSPNQQEAAATISKIQHFVRQQPVIYLPSHDPLSEKRLRRQLIVTIHNNEQDHETSQIHKDISLLEP